MSYYVTNDNSFLDIKNAHLRVTGNVHTDVLKVGSIGFQPAGSNISGTVNFTNVTTGVTTTSNLNVGGTLNLGTIELSASTHTLDHITARGNVTSTTVQFDNATTGLVTTSNVEVGGELTVSGNVEVGGELTVSGGVVSNVNLLSVSNVASIKVDSNVVTEYTGPHDRPLREYPEIAMTTASGTSSGYKGYKVSTSSQLSGFEGYKAFDKTGWETPAVENNNAWVSGGSKYVTSTGLPDTGAFTTSYVGGTATGEYIQLQLPRKIKISKYDYTPRTHTGNDEGKGAPKTVKLLGSNDGNTWTLIKDITHTGTRPEEGVFYTAQVDATQYYDYIRFVATSTYGTFGDVRLSQIRFYGHEEGSGSLDTTLKTVYNVPATTGTQLEVYYDGRETSSYSGSGTTVNDISPNTNNGTLNGGVGFDSTYKAFTFDGSNDSITATYPSSTGDNTFSMSMWVKRDSNSGEMCPFFLGDAATGEGIGMDIKPNGQVWWFIYGGKNFLWSGRTYEWFPVGTWTHVTVSHTAGTDFINLNKVWINGVEVTDEAVFGGNANDLSLDENDTLTLGARADPTNYLDGSIANFRLYSKVLSTGQVQELYDYQKDYFFGSKSQVTLYKGHLGVGVTEPSGQLELAGDERIQEYPPRAMTDYDTHIEGHGVFKVYASSWLDNSSFKSWAVFDKNINGVGWHDTGAPYTNGSHTGLSSLAGIKGEWIVLKLPYAINLKSAATAPRTGYTMRAPGAGVILGSNDGNTWDQLHSFSGLTATDNTLTHVGNITAPGYYTTFALLVTELAGAPSSTNTNSLNISEIKFFGIPGPTTLDKGSLSLTQILDVPRVSRYDVDAETPRPEKLILNYDTTVNSRPVDISGKGNHGEFYGNAKYSKEERAFQFDGSSDTVYIDHNGYGVGVKGFPTGDATYTMSMWIKANEGQTNNAAAVFYFGSAWTTAQLAGIYHSVGGKINMDVGARNIATTNQVIFPGRWHHVAIVKRGTGAISTDHSYGSIYIDGEEVTNLTLTGGGDPSQSLNTIDNVSIGSNFNGSAGSFTEGFDGWVAKPQVWNVPLENSEIRKIYNLGHTGRSMMIIDTAIGIGKAPEAQLDVRGTGRFQGLGVNTDNLIGALQVHQGPNIPFGGTSDTIQDVVPGFVISSDSAKWTMFINTNDDFIFTSHDSLSGTYTGATGYILEGAYDQRMNDFTGQHRCFLRGIPREQIQDKVGLIVSSDKNKYTMISGDIVTGQNAIDISESIPDVSISQKAHDKACFGVISDVEDPEKREDLYGVFGTPFPKEKGDDRVYINSVGEGAIWVANTNGSLEAGDYITTSNVAGYGQKQDGAGLMNYTVAKITMDCDFNPETQPIQKIKKKQEITRYWRSSSGEESTEEKDGFDELVEKVEIVNDLDEHGQIQWEDDPTETEKAYKVRYLTVDGTQTDEANAVHTAAFVGCTYHCG